MSIGKPHALAGQTIDVGRYNFFCPIATYITVTKIVGKNNDDIGWGGFIPHRGRRMLKDDRAKENRD